MADADALPGSATALPPAQGIRNLVADDLPAVADLFQRTFRDPDTRPPQSLADYLGDLFLRHPGYDPELAARVYVGANNTLGGFIGILPVPMVLHGRPIRAAVAGSLMVERPDANPLAGARLLRSFLSGPQDLSFSETANPLSQGMWEKLGGTALPTYSMEWVRVLRPAGLAVLLAGERFAPFRPFGALGRGADRLVARAMRGVLALPAPDPHVVDSEVDLAQAASLVRQYADMVPLHPVFDPAVLNFMLAHAREKERHGTLSCRLVVRGHRPLGCYFYYVRPGKVAWVLQILSLPEAIGTVIDSLFAQAERQGCVAVRGRTQPSLLDPLLRRRCVMLHRASMVVQTRDSEVLAAINSGDAMLTGFAGETWTRLIGGDFS